MSRYAFLHLGAQDWSKGFAENWFCLRGVFGLFFKQVKWIASTGQELPSLTPDCGLCFLETKVKILGVASPVKITNEMLKQVVALQQYLKPDMTVVEQ